MFLIFRHRYPICNISHWQMIILTALPVTERKFLTSNWDLFINYFLEKLRLMIVLPYKVYSKIFLPASGKSFYWVRSCLYVRAPAHNFIYWIQFYLLIHNFLKNFTKALLWLAASIEKKTTTTTLYYNFRSSRSELFLKIAALKYLRKFARKHPWWSFLIKL